MKRNKLILRRALFSVIFFSLLNTLTAQVIVKDIFDRELNDYQITLVDWQGHLHNPKVKLNLTPPQSGVTFPLTVTIKAEGTSRLMLNSPSTLSGTGAGKTVTFNAATSEISVLLAIAPDRQGGFGEIESYTLTFEYEGTSNSVPIKVIDQDDDLEPRLPINFDYRYDNINAVFDDSRIKEASELAIKDWFYFFDYSSFDEVAAGDENISLTGSDWKNHIQVTNNEPYNGWWVFMRGIDSPYSTGYPANNGKYHKQNGVQVPGPIQRSGALIIQFDETTNWFTSVADESWYLSDIYTYDDIYGLAMHEFGHAVAFNYTWSGFTNYRNKYTSAQKVIDYQGYAVPVDQSAHIPSDPTPWDRISGQSSGWKAEFPVRRWMLTKLHLLIAQEVGWKLREIGPFIAPEINTAQLAAAEAGMAYNQTLESNGGGVAIYDWTISSGALPDGLALNRFTGEISGNVAAEANGEYNFTVQLKDYDELQAPVTKQLSIEVASCAAPNNLQYTSISPTEVSVNWNASSSGEYSVYYQSVGGDPTLVCEGTTNTSCTISDLSPDTDYIVRVNSLCPDGNQGTSIEFRTEAIASCGTPTSVIVSEISESGSVISWAKGLAESYEVEYHAVGGDWIGACSSTTDTTCTLTGLDYDTDYIVRVNSVCPEGNYETRVEFRTLSISCSAPATVTATDITSTSATLNWSETSANHYYIYYKAVDGGWILACNGTTDNKCVLTDLTPDTEYVAWANSVCDDGNYGNSVEFKTEKLGTAVSNIEENTLQVYPNPVHDILNIQFGDNKINKQYEIYSINGIKLMESNEQKLNVSQLPKGVYVLKLNEIIARFVKL